MGEGGEVTGVSAGAGCHLDVLQVSDGIVIRDNTENTHSRGHSQLGFPIALGCTNTSNSPQEKTGRRMEISFGGRREAIDLTGAM